MNAHKCPKCRTLNGLLAFLRKQGVSLETINAMRKNDRKRFILKSNLLQAYYNSPLSIGHDVTISQPSLVGYMIDQLQIDNINHILELGTGSAWNASIIADLIPYGSLTTIERVTALGKRAKQLLATKSNVQVVIGDAVNINYAHPFDRIIVTAEFMNKQQVTKFVKKNAAHFCIAIYPYNGILWKMTKCGGKITTSKLMAVRFVPVIETD